MSENTPEIDETLSTPVSDDSAVNDAENVDAAAESAAEAPAAEAETAADAAAAGDADGAAAEEEAAAELANPYEDYISELSMQDGDWYVINSYAGYENRVKTNLENRVVSMDMEDYIFEIQVPMEDVIEIKNGQRKQIRRVRIPGYVLVRMDLTDESWGVVRHTPGVMGFVGNAYDPTPLTISEVASMLAPVFDERLAEEEAAKGEQVDPTSGAPIEVEFEIGESVRVTDGSFEGHDATVQEIRPEQQKLTVLLQIFERDVPVELSFNQVGKL